MLSWKKCSSYCLILMVLLACYLDESDATRRVNRGRRTLTRKYFTGLGIPGWILILCLAIGELIIGAALYFILYKIILSKDSNTAATYTPASQHDPDSQSVPVPPAAATPAKQQMV